MGTKLSVRKRRQGNAIIEFALMASAMVPLLTGVTQFGHTFFMYNQLVSAVKAGSRYASVREYGGTTSTVPTEFATEVKNMVVYGKEDPVTTGVSPDQPVVKGLSVNNISVSVTMNGTTPKTVTVNVVNFTIGSIFKKFTFNGKPAATYPFNGS
ncbi:MAG: pilus assembly protein [Acidobacteria bacterium]|nr:pilus assembly protein [Acidobacteriota bacterium]